MQGREREGDGQRQVAEHKGKAAAGRLRGGA
jgi:hypothetical protein